MGCRLGRVKLVEENINQANKRMEQIEKIFEVLTNDSRLKDIINQIEKITVIVIMFYNRRMNTNQTLVKIKSSYDKLEKAMNEPAKDYNAIKELVESKENSIMNIKSIKNKDLKNKDMAFIPAQKKKNKK